ncbi:MAG: GDSL-type esterase/lipase family protein [Cyclobacteriaceae bacterium]|nr:sialate O-acetylesterase [Cyclobacteriaceae bacterium]MCH8516325.1 GDSL-type esterase/lipase family protein [Cyclobacteriaceae bacterium]
MIRKYHLLLFLILFVKTLVPVVVAQEAVLDSSFENSYYLQKISIHQQLRIGEKSIVFLGNSLTDIGAWTEWFASHPVKNRGISSDITYGVLHRLPDILKGKPSKIFLMIGINDVARDIPDEMILQNIRKMILMTERKSPHTKLYLHSILPTYPDMRIYKNHYHKNQVVRALNIQLERMSQELGITYIDLAKLLADENGNLDPSYTNDGLHLTQTGYEVWLDHLKEKKYCCP